jgi:hypothetical protein
VENGLAEASLKKDKEPKQRWLLVAFFLKDESNNSENKLTVPE